MATQYLRLGFENQVLRPDGFYNILLHGKQVGFNVDLRINYYRGLPLSCVRKIELTVDGKQIPQELMLFQLREKCFTLQELPKMYREYWGIKTPAHLRVFNYGLAEGEHDVVVWIELTCPYMEFAPGIYGVIDGSKESRMVLQKARELD